MSGQRPAANRMVFMQFKARLVGAKKGHGLLKKKRDALKKEFETMLKKIVTNKLEVGASLKDAAFSFAKANWATGGADISQSVIERAKKPSVTCKLKSNNIAGVKLPVFEMTQNSKADESMQTIGVGHGGAVIGACRETYVRALKAIVMLASLQTTFYTLDEEIKMTSRRVNALEYVLIPRIEDIMKYIEQEMDEQSREEFFRVKKVVEKKKQRIAREKAEAAAEGNAVIEPPAASALEDDNDADLVY